MALCAKIVRRADPREKVRVHIYDSDRSRVVKGFPQSRIVFDSVPRDISIAPLAAFCLSS